MDNTFFFNSLGGSYQNMTHSNSNQVSLNPLNSKRIQWKQFSRKLELISQKIVIDIEVIKLRPEDIDTQIQSVIEKSTKSKEKLDILTEEFKLLKDVEYDSETHKEWIQQERSLNILKGNKESEASRINKLI